MGNWRRIVASCAGMVCACVSVYADDGEALIVRVKAEAIARLEKLDELAPLRAAGLQAPAFVRLVDFEVGDPQLAARLGLDRYFRIEIPQRANIAEIFQSLSERADLFESVEHEYWGTTADITPSDHFFHLQWNLRNIGQGVQCPARATAPGPGARSSADIAAPTAWERTTGSPAIIVAILDSGITPHVDLPSLRPGWSEDGLSTHDQCSHGTHVAGTLGAQTDNGIGIAGVMWEVGILPVRVLRGCSGTDINYGRGIIWAADRAHIANSSLQYYTVGSFMHLAVQYAYERGLVMVAATGNNAAVVAYPARLPGVIGVGATTYTDTLASFSNQGPQVTLSAPGESVYSLLPRTFIQGIATGSGCLSGTSMASPHVAGVAGLIKSIQPLASPRAVERILISSVSHLGAPGWNQQFGWGRLNAARALMLTDCYIDCTMDEKLDGDDFQCFLTRFTESHPYADMNDDGRHTVDDLTIYMQQFKTGCVR